MSSPNSGWQAEIDAVFSYHARTKHHFHRYAASLGYLDWANQPHPFRRYEGATQIALSLEDAPAPVPYDALYEPSSLPVQPVNLETISRFLRYSLALSAWKESGASRWALRVNPSSGNLHPTEAYLILPSIDEPANCPAVYHYVSESHALEHRATLPEPTWNALLGEVPAGKFLVGLSSIIWREAWKYGERAFRYCQHDIGHAIAALRFSAALNNWRFQLLSGWSSEDMAALLGLDRDGDFVSEEREETELLAIVTPQSDSEAAISVSPPIDEIRQSLAGVEWFGTANCLSREHVNWPVIAEVAAATRIARHANSDTLTGESSLPSKNIPAMRLPQAKAQQTILKRRSCLALDGRTSISRECFLRMMARTLPGAHAPWDATGAMPLIHLALFVHRVDGLSPGLYVLVRDNAGCDRLQAAMSEQFVWQTPPGVGEDFPLYLLAESDCRDAARQLSCQQEIAADGFFSLGMIAEFESPIREHGAWFYRNLFWEAGMVGQVLYLEAEAAGFRSTGIGCYFDDPVHDILGLKENEFQSLYHFTVGNPVDDPRLRSLPAYSPSAYDLAD